MLKTLVVLSLTLISLSASAETKLNFNGDAYVRGYFKNSYGPSGTQALSQFFRINVEAKPDDNLTVKMGAILSSNNWDGDSQTTLANGGTGMGGTNDDGTGNSNITRLDHAVIQYKKENWIGAAGRMIVTSPGGFLTADERRDRLSLIRLSPKMDVLVFIFDKRAENSLTNARDDVDMYSINYYGTFVTDQTYKYAMQTAIWKAKKYALVGTSFNGPNLDNIKQITPQLEGKVAGIDFNFYYTILFGGSALYKNDHHAAAFKLARDFEIFKVEVQTMMTLNGGLISGGFDSLSSMVNNNPDHNQSQIRMKNIGLSLGANKSDEQLHMVRISKALTSDLTASIGGGYGRFYTAATSQLEDNKLLDATGKFTFSPNLSLNAAYGRFFGDFKEHAGSLTLKALF